MGRLIGRVRADDRGGAIVEFAIIAPVMIALLLGVVCLVQGFDVQRRVKHVAFAVADLVSQEKSLSQADVATVLDAGAALIHPLPATTLGQRVASFTADDQGKVATDWQVSRGVYKGTEALAPPAGMLKANESVIIADASYDFSPLKGSVLPASITLTSRAILRPRTSSKVTLAP